MHLPTITAGYLAILALFYAVLALRVMRLRQGNRAAFGDGDSTKLRSAIRAHANFIEYVPIITLMVGVPRNVRRVGAADPPADGRATGCRGCCIRSACMRRRTRCHFGSAGSAASPSRSSC